MKNIKLPFFLKITVIIVGLFVFVYILYVGRSIILPLIFAFLLSIILHPIVQLLMKWKFKRIIAIAISVIIMLLLLAGLTTFFITQFSRFSETFPQIAEKFTGLLSNLSQKASENLDIEPTQIDGWIQKGKDQLMNSAGTALGQTITIVGNTVFVLFLIPVYVFMILYYKPLFSNFISKLFGSSQRVIVDEVKSKIKSLIQNYLIGLLIEASIIAVLETTVLLLFGIEYAILLGVLGALLNMIPYIGTIVATILPVIIALTTKDSAWIAVYVAISFYVIQLIDNNLIIPRIVASKVKINAFVAIVAILFFESIWGIPGMFLSLPLMAIIKLIFDNLKPLKPYGYVLGDEV